MIVAAGLWEAVGDWLRALSPGGRAALAVVALLALLGLLWAGRTVVLVWPLVRRSLRQHALSTLVTVIAGALASGLMMAVFAIQKQTVDAFTGGPIGFDAVLGARGNPLQLVLNAVFHLETSPGNIPWSLYEEIRRRPYVKLAIPYALGDNYRGFRIVGTTEELFTRFEYRPGRTYRIRAGGRVFDPARYEAVIGSYVAQQTQLRVGSTFNPYHGLDYDPGQRHAEEYLVVGILAPTNTPADRVIWIPIEGVYRIAGHALRGAGVEYRPRPEEQIPDEHKEVSAVMLKLTDPQVGSRLEREVNREGRVATLAWPIGSVMADLFSKIGWVSRVLELVAYLVVAVAAGAIMASIYNTINERRREFAILRALGARRSTVLAAIVTESAAIGALGSLLGFVVYAAILAAATIVIRTQTGVVLDWTAFHWILPATPVGMIVIGALVGLVPAIKAYTTDVATNLAPTT
jgi:putative ABC transport system permease protein